MELRLRRIACKPGYTIGKLYVNGKYFCDTLEDRDRNLDDSMNEQDIREAKVYSQTAIPTGTYTITLNIQSPKFKKRAAYKFCNGYIPRLLDVKGFDGILIHIGNTPEHSAGCILVGKNTVVGQVLNSTATFKKLYSLMALACQNKEKISITIEK